ncbi:MAG: hypothetical protein EOM12_04150 [Verrucomicrobiae bacterium]|nr:hypothetical protein [Verrucomicrobiae bacterium]
MRNTKNIGRAFVLGAGFGALVAACFTHAFNSKAPSTLSSSQGEHTPPASVLDHHDYQLLVQKMATSLLKQRLADILLAVLCISLICK